MTANDRKRLQRQILFWTGVLAVFVALLYLLRPILLPFIAGLVVAYFLNPLAVGLMRLHFSRLAATLTILVAFLVIFVAILLVLIPVLGEQIGRFVANVPDYVDALRELFEDHAPEWLRQMLSEPLSSLTGSFSEIAGRGAEWLGTILGSVWTGGLVLFNLISLLIITPIVAFYVLNDWERMVDKVDGWLPRDHRDTIRGLIAQMNEAVSGFIRGQGTVCTILAVFYAATLSLLGLNFGLLIGIASGILNFIPYVGSTTGFILAVGMALVQFWPDWTLVLAVGVVFLFGQAAESYALQPMLVGDRVGLHPVWLMFSLFAFGYLFGFVGLLLAVPLAACVAVLLRFGLARYMDSPLYRGSGAGMPKQRP